MTAPLNTLRPGWGSFDVLRSLQRRTISVVHSLRASPQSPARARLLASSIVTLVSNKCGFGLRCHEILRCMQSETQTSSHSPVSRAACDRGITLSCLVDEGDKFHLVPPLPPFADCVGVAIYSCRARGRLLGSPRHRTLGCGRDSVCKLIQRGLDPL